MSVLPATLLGLFDEPALLVSVTGEVVHTNELADEAFGPLRGRRLAAQSPEPDEAAERLARLARSTTLVPTALTLRGRSGEAARWRCKGARLGPEPDAPLLLRLVLADEANSRFVTLTETIQALSSEILRRKVTEQELAASERQLRQLADAMPQIVWAAGPDGRADYSNERWYEFTGLPREEGAAAGQRWLEFLHPDDVEPSLARWSAAVRSGDRYEDEFRFQDRRTGGYRWHLARAIPIRDESGQVVRWFGTCTDIDDQKRAQEALEASDRRKDEFLAMLAHELRNPLAPMTTALHLLRLRTGEREDLGRPLDVLARQTQHLTKLVDDLLDVSRVTRGKIRLQPEPVDATAAVQRAVELGRPLLDARRHRLEVMLPREPLWVRADPTRLVQVLGNLLNNAAKFTDEGGRILVEVALDGQEVAFRVRDDGVGIAADLLPHLFQIFTQGDATLDRAAGGLGIGLALVRGLVELHGGRVDAQSDGPGRGSEFVVRLPRLDPPGQPLPAHDDVFALLRGLGPRRVLVVDDNLDAAASLAEVFAVSGHLVEQAHDGPSALVAARAHAPTVVLLDLGLPRMDGYEVARQLRREHGAALEIFALSGYGLVDDGSKARAAGFDHHLVKPVDLASLAQLLARGAGPRAPLG